VFFNENFNESSSFMFDELFMEANGELHIMKDYLAPIVDGTLADPQKDRTFKKEIGNYINRNITKLTEAGPMDLIPFGDDDKRIFFSIFNLDSNDVISKTKEMTKVLNSNAKDFKYLHGNPVLFLFYFCIRYYYMKRDVKGLNSALSIYALAVYPSVFNMSFKYGVKRPVMQYTMDNLTDKFLMKKKGNLFATLVESIQRSFKFLQSEFNEAYDTEIVRFIQRIHNDQKSMIKKIATEYYKNNAKGLAVSITNDTYDDDTPILDDVTNATSQVENISRRILLPILTNGVDIKRAEAAAKICGIGVSDCRYYLTLILVDKNSDSLQKFLEAVLFLYLYDEHKSPQNINSSYFLTWGMAMFKKTNSNNKNIKLIKSTLDKWAEASGIHNKYTREASRVNYKKAIFLYILLSIQKYNN